MIPRELVERIRSETDIVSLVGSYIKLKRTGRSFVGLCPFHQEKTPSFNVSPDKQVYYCFGCGAGGNAITFLMNYENVSFPEAVKRLGERLGIRVTYTEEDDPTKPLAQALELANQIYKENLFSERGKDARAYLSKRGLSQEAVKKFELGLVPQDTSLMLSRARDAKLSTSVLRDSGVLGASSGRFYPFLAGRISFPIHSAAGRLVGFSGRTWGEDPNPAKYVNTPETRLFKKSRLLYGLHQARPYLRREGGILVEGQMDVLKLAQEGFDNAVAPLGTAFGTGHAALLSRYAEQVTLVFDGDEPGRNAARRALPEVLSVDLETKLLLLPEGEDPDSFLSSHSSEEFSRLLAEAAEPIPFLYRLLSPSTVAERRKAAQEMVSLIRRVPDSIKQELYLEQAADLVGVSTQVLAAKLRPGKASRSRKPSMESAGDTEELLLRMMVHNPEFIELASEHLETQMLEQPEAAQLLAELYRMKGEMEELKISRIVDELPAFLQEKVSAWSFSRLDYSRDEFMRTLAHYLYTRRRRMLREQLREAERAGDLDEAQKILGRLNELVKESNKIYEEL